MAKGIPVEAKGAPVGSKRAPSGAKGVHTGGRLWGPRRAAQESLQAVQGPLRAAQEASSGQGRSDGREGSSRGGSPLEPR